MSFVILIFEVIFTFPQKPNFLNTKDVLEKLIDIISRYFPLVCGLLINLVDIDFIPMDIGIESIHVNNIIFKVCVGRKVLFYWLDLVLYILSTFIYYKVEPMNA